MPNLHGNEFLYGTPNQTATAPQSSTTVSACSSVLHTPQQSAQKQRRVAFSLAMPSSTLYTSEEGNQSSLSAPMMHSTSAPGLQNGFDALQHGDPHGMAARFHAANAAYQEGIYGPHHTMMHNQMVSTCCSFWFKLLLPIANIHITDGSWTLLQQYSRCCFRCCLLQCTCFKRT
jgi:hypothetical protein